MRFQWCPVRCCYCTLLGYQHRAHCFRLCRHLLGPEGNVVEFRGGAEPDTLAGGPCPGYGSEVAMVKPKRMFTILRMWYLQVFSAVVNGHELAVHRRLRWGQNEVYFPAAQDAGVVQMLLHLHSRIVEIA
jgi:hypothetical protein